MWLDTFSDCYNDTNGKKKIGFQLILIHDNETSQIFDTIVGGRSLIWKKVSGTRVPLYPSGINFLETYYRKNKYEDVFIPEPIKERNNEWIARCLSKHHGTYPTCTLIDLYLFTRGLQGNLWFEFPHGIPGIKIDKRLKYHNEEAWIYVEVTEEFTPPVSHMHVLDLLPCSGVITWDNSA